MDAGPGEGEAFPQTAMEPRRFKSTNSLRMVEDEEEGEEDEEEEEYAESRSEEAKDERSEGT